MKITIVLLLAFILGCSSDKQEKKSSEAESKAVSGERQSIHQKEWEQHQEQQNSTDSYSKLIIEDIAVVADSNIGSFNNPIFSNNGKFILFTNHDFNQIWIHYLKDGFNKKIINMPGCGVNFQLSHSDENIYFRTGTGDARKKKREYLLLNYSFSEEKTEVVYKSEKRISTPILVNGLLYFLEEGKPFFLDLKTNQKGSSFRKPFYYVENNFLIKVTDRTDTLKLTGNAAKFISCRYSADGGFIYVLTSDRGTALFDIEGNLLKLFEDAVDFDKLSGSSLVVYSSEKDDGMKLTESNLYIGFLNSGKRISIGKNTDEQRFNPRWAHSHNMIVYSNNDGQIKTVSFNFK